MKEIYKKIAAAKKQIGAISKDTTNDFFKAKYYDINKLIEIVEPELEKQGLLLLQPIFDGKVITRIVDIKTGEEMKSEMELPKQDNPQKIGSAITYYRRYTLASLLALQAEDDDGNNAAKPEPKKVVKKLITQAIIKSAVLKQTTIEVLKQFYIMDAIQEEEITKMLEDGSK